MTSPLLQDSNSATRFLHITDLHVGKSGESQKTALSSLIAAIEKFSENIPFHHVLLTGDLTNCGSEEEFSRLEDIFLKPLKALPVCRDAAIHAVPGNHDLECDIGYPPTWASIGKDRQEKFFNLDENGRKTRSGRAEAFTQYSNFIKRNGIHSVDPTIEPAKVNEFKSANGTYAFISVVTAFFSDKETNDFQKTPAPVHAIRTLSTDLSPDTRIIILGHHPMEHFIPDTSKHLYSLIVDSDSLYLHGHEHIVNPHFGCKGLTSLGLGAAYQASNDSSAKPFYRNSFSIFEITDSLHISIFSWDSEYGQWKIDQHLPADFSTRSSRLKDGYVFNLPTTKISDQAPRNLSLASAIESFQYIDNCIWLADAEPKRWIEILKIIGQLRNVTNTYALPTQTLPVGHCIFRANDHRGLNLIRAVSSKGDILNYDLLEAINTDLDKDDFDRSIVITLGELSAEAKTLATQLASKKPITVLERTEVVRLLIRNLPNKLATALSQVDISSASGSLIITETGFAILLQDRINNTWFYVLDNDGKILPESDALIIRLRQENLNLSNLRYHSAGAGLPISDTVTPVKEAFDKKEYLQKSHAYFDDVKYAPLAALGFKFRNSSLTNMYVDASADVGGNRNTSQRVHTSVAEIVESLNLPASQREQLETQLRSRLGSDRPSEVGAARRLYQKYNNVVVLGDPGSGKTCFVKHEILAYCIPPLEEGSWYTQHIPIYVSLAEAARLLDEQTDLLCICEIVSSRRGIVLPRHVIEDALSNGRAAFFFDGLDEVGYLDKKISLVQGISELIKVFASKGNRFVLASRPAAIQPVDIPDTLIHLQLKGLTEQEIRILAGRVLTSRLGEGEPNLTDEEKDLIDRLIEDTHVRQGIARLAKNPLLLTLLVLIYANTGALSAKRHLIYTQAVKTLVGVRGKKTREQQISEADLRTRLGSLALAIFKREIAEIPRRSEVVKVISPSIENHDGSESYVNAFLQEVAEATGLLVIHPGEDEVSEDIITFMHYSFLEYYVAAGLLSREYLNFLPSISNNPRWKDVTTLLFGILSEQSDITPVLKKILAENSPVEAITKYRLILAFECANECDVPPEAAQDLLAEELHMSLSQGIAKYSASFRTILASKLQPLLQGTGPRIEIALIKGLSDQNNMCVAATADLIAQLDNNVKLSKVLQDEFQKCLNNDDPIVRTSVMYAIEMRAELRSEKAETIVQDSLEGSIVEKHAAMKVINAVPSFYHKSSGKIRKLLDDSNELISATAARCLLDHALQSGHWYEETSVQEKVLDRIKQNDSEDALSLTDITLDKKTIENLILSPNPNETELAIHYLPLIKNDDNFVYKLLFDKLRSSNTSSKLRVASLNSLRLSPGAMDLITIADTDAICNGIKSPERNVRMATLKLLGEMPDDQQVVQNLQQHLQDCKDAKSKDEEINEAAKALGKHIRRNQNLRTQVLESLLVYLPKGNEPNFGDSSKQQHLLGLMLVCESIGEVINKNTAYRLQSLANNFRTPISIRKQALKVFGRLAEPTEENVDYFIKLLKTNDRRLNESIYAACLYFISHCRRKVEYVRQVYKKLNSLKDQLCAVWNRELVETIDNIDPRGLNDIRDTLVEIENLIISYDEFSERAKIKSVHQ